MCFFFQKWNEDGEKGCRSRVWGSRRSDRKLALKHTVHSKRLRVPRKRRRPSKRSGETCRPSVMSKGLAIHSRTGKKIQKKEIRLRKHAQETKISSRITWRGRQGRQGSQLQEEEEEEADSSIILGLEACSKLHHCALNKSCRSHVENLPLSSESNDLLCTIKFLCCTAALKPAASASVTLQEQPSDFRAASEHHRAASYRTETHACCDQEKEPKLGKNVSFLRQ